MSGYLISSVLRRRTILILPVNSPLVRHVESFRSLKADGGEPGSRDG